MKIDFIKMHGCGNDFMIIDNRSGQYNIKPEHISFMADRKTGVGFDQLIVLDLSEKAAVAMKIYNADGTTAGMCGNAIRCIAGIVLDDVPEDQVLIEMPNNKIVSAKAETNGDIVVDLGSAIFHPELIPLQAGLDAIDLNFNIMGLPSGIALSVGNPHLVFFLDKNHNLDINTLGPQLEYHEYFPDRVNVSFASLIDLHNISLDVWERGVGRTLACGSAAAATAVAAVVRGLCEMNDEIAVRMKGGALKLSVDSNYVIKMTGPYHMVFKGIIEIENA